MKGTPNPRRAELKALTYAQRVAELEAEGLTTSDAQGVADAEQQQGRRFDFDPEHPADNMPQERAQ